jgi:hypothetical protein
MDGPSGNSKRHQHLRRARRAVLYQTLCRPLSKRKQAYDVAFPPSFGGRRVSQSTTPLYAIVLLRVVESGSDQGCEYWRDDYCVEDIKQLDLHDLCRAMAWLGEELAALDQADRTLVPRRISRM